MILAIIADHYLIVNYPDHQLYKCHMEIQRQLQLAPLLAKKSFFLFRPRATGNHYCPSTAGEKCLHHRSFGFTLLSAAVQCSLWTGILDCCQVLRYYRHRWNPTHSGTSQWNPQAHRVPQSHFFTHWIERKKTAQGQGKSIGRSRLECRDVTADLSGNYWFWFKPLPSLWGPAGRLSNTGLKYYLFCL